MPRAFLVKKRGPKRGGCGTSPNGLINTDVTSINNCVPKEIIPIVELPLSPSYTASPSPALSSSPGEAENRDSFSPIHLESIKKDGDRQEGEEKRLREATTPGHDETDGHMEAWSIYDHRRWDGENQLPRHFDGERSEGKKARYGNDGVNVTPPQGVVPSTFSIQTMRKTSPDAAIEPEKMATHRSPAFPSSSGSSLRAIGYITSTRNGTKITIEKTPGEVIHYPSPPPQSPTSSPPPLPPASPTAALPPRRVPSSSPPRSSPPLPRSRSPLRSRSPVMSRSPPTRSRSPLVPPHPFPSSTHQSPYARSSIWAPHREVDRLNYDDVYGASTYEERFYGERAYRPFPSPPSYRNMLSFSPDLPSQQERSRFSPEGHYKMCDIKQESTLPPEPLLPRERSQSRGYSFDQARHTSPKQQYMDAAPRLSQGMLTTTSRGLGPISDSRLGNSQRTSAPSNSGPPASYSRESLSTMPSFLTERISPSNSTPVRQKIGEHGDSDLYQKGQFDSRYHSMASSYTNHNNHFNGSAIKDNNGSKSWKDGEVAADRIKPKIPWGIENVPVDMDGFRTMATKKRGENDPPRFQCDACKKSYATHGGLSKHKQFHCTATIKKEFSCKYCPKTYVSLGALKMHIRTHTLPCKCHLCGKAFSRPWLLQGHVRTHTGEKPFQCSHCGRSFADRSNLRAHLQTHTDIKKYNCRTCSKSFSRNSLLLKHEDGGCINAI